MNFNVFKSVTLLASFLLLAASSFALDPNLDQIADKSAFSTRYLTYTDYFSDAAKTNWVGTRIVQCSGRVREYGTRTSYYIRETEPCWGNGFKADQRMAEIEKLGLVFQSTAVDQATLNSYGELFDLLLAENFSHAESGLHTITLFDVMGKGEAHSAIKISFRPGQDGLVDGSSLDAFLAPLVAEQQNKAGCGEDRVFGRYDVTKCYGGTKCVETWEFYCENGQFGSRMVASDCVYVGICRVEPGDR